MKLPRAAQRSLAAYWLGRLTETQQRALLVMGGRPDDWHMLSCVGALQTQAALVRRGLAEFTAWGDKIRLTAQGRKLAHMIAIVQEEDTEG